VRQLNAIRRERSYYVGKEKRESEKPMSYTNEASRLRIHRGG